MLTVLYVFIGLFIIQCFVILVKGPSNSRIGWLKITIGFLVILSTAVLLGASKPDSAKRYKLHEIQTTLSHVMKTKVRKVDRRKIDVPAVSEAIREAQNKFEVPGLLLIAIGYYESRYQISAIGDQGRSKGILQVGPMGRRRCREHCGTMTTEYEQIMCGGCWLRENINWCGSLERGLNGYAWGKCRAIYASTKNAVQRRFQMWYNLHDDLYDK